MPIAAITPNFQAQLNKLTADAAADVAALQLQVGARRVWQSPVPNGWNGSPLQLTGPTGVAAAYDRTDANQMYADAITTSADSAGGRLGDRLVAKAEVDYLACLEPSYRARQATGVRCLYLSAARRQGHSNEQGVIGGLATYLQNVLQSAYIDPKGV